ncbi:MAG: hypothetical protein ACK4ND_10620 [Cytophagaceae bacterium]
MKTKLLLMPVILTVGVLFIFLSAKSKDSHVESVRTEEYVIVDVEESGKKKFIRVTRAGVDKDGEWKEEKTSDPQDYSPVLKVLHELNEEGFEVVNASLAYASRGVNNVITAQPRHTFFLKKKL